MNVLAFDTCLGACSAAVAASDPHGRRRTVRALELLDTGHAEALMPMIERVMAEAGLPLLQIDRIAVTHGPGTFTGTRIGVAAARALTLATGAPAVAFSSLLPIGLAALRDVPALQDQDAGVIVAADARGGMLFVQVIAASAGALTPPQLLTPSAAAALAPALRLAAVGTGAAMLADAARAAGRTIALALDGSPLPEHHQPDASLLLGLAEAAVPGAEPIRPLYLRPPDARPPSDSSVPRAMP